MSHFHLAGLDERHERVATPLRILVIDDEPMICRVVRDVFEHERVEAFVNPVAALERARTEHFDLVLCDLRMPGISGIDVHAALAHSAPHLAHRFVLMTGSSTDEGIAEFLATSGAILLSKPFRLVDLERCVRELVVREGLRVEHIQNVALP